MDRIKQSLSVQVLTGLLLGLVIGTIFQYLVPQDSAIASYVLPASDGLGGMFVSMIKLIVVPLVFISITSGICELKDLSSIGRLGSKTFGLYVINTIVAIALTMLIVFWLQPGTGVDLATGGQAMQLAATEPPSIGNMIVNIIPSNPFQAFVEGDMLQIIFMAILTGVAIQALDHKGGLAIRTFKVANDVMIKLITLVMSLAPYGVFFLMITLGATLDVQKLTAVAGYVGLVVGMFILAFSVIYP